MRLLKSTTSRKIPWHIKGTKTHETLHFFELQQLSLAVFFETDLPLRIKDGPGNSTICGSSAQINMGIYSKSLLD
jgi:hypothetical protein